MATYTHSLIMNSVAPNTISYRMNSLLSLVILSVVMSSCADPVPNDYTEEIYIEGFAIAGLPLTKVRVNRTLPVSESYSIEKAAIKDALVMVKENGVDIPMTFVEDTLGGFYEALDSNFRVAYNSTYDLTVGALGKTLRATATTLAPFQWVVPPKDTITYPGEEGSTEIYDSLKIYWEGQQGIPLYVLGIESVDTAKYGIYLNPPTIEPNERIQNEMHPDESPLSKETIRYGFAFVSNSPIVWRAFRWFGKQRIHVYAGDNAFREWFQEVGGGFRSQYDYRLSNISGGLGVWAGASVIYGDLFLKKEQTR